MIRLLSTDFDGTLVNHEASPAVAPELMELFASLRAKGVRWAVNTGRTVDHIVQGLAEFGFETGPDFILSSERHVFCPTASGGWQDYGDWNARCDRAHEELFSATKEILEEVAEYVKTETRGQVLYEKEMPMGLIASSEEEMDRIAKFIGEAGTRHPQFHYQRNTVYVRFCHIEYSKGAALGELGRLLAIPREEIFAAGDHYNDIPMLDGRFAQWCACPANSAEAVKVAVRKAGGWVAKRDCSEGVIEALRAFLESSALSSST